MLEIIPHYWAEPGLPVTYLLSPNGTCCPACQRGRCIATGISAVRLLCLQSFCWRAPCVFFVFFFSFCENAWARLLIDWWKISGCSIRGVFVSVITVCSQTGARSFSTSPAIDLRVLSSFNSLFQAHGFQDISSFPNAVVQTFNIYL